MLGFVSLRPCDEIITICIYASICYPYLPWHLYSISRGTGAYWVSWRILIGSKLLNNF